MTLDIIVPHYHEPQEVVTPLLESIKLQGGVEFKDIQVLIVNDGTDVPLDREKFNGYPFKVKYYEKKHEGVSAARNYGLDKSKADYVMFCDFDDRFLNLYGLYLVFSAMQKGSDAITSSFVEEHKNEDGSYKIVRRDNDATFVHGKIYRREYLVKNNLRFNPKLTIHEDGYFNCLAMLSADTKDYITTPFYLWCWGKNTVSQKGNTIFVLQTYDHVMDTRIAICEQAMERGFIDESYDFIVKTVLDSYYDFNKPEYLDPANKDLVKKAEKAFKRFYMQFRDLYHEANMMKVREIAYVARQNAFVNGLNMEKWTLHDWLNHIVKEVEE